MSEKKLHYDNQMDTWRSSLNGQNQRIEQPPLQRRVSQSTNNLPQLVNQESAAGYGVNLRSHRDIRYHMNVIESNYYWDRQRMEKYKNELDEQVRDTRRRKMLEKQIHNGTELAPLLKSKSPSLPKLPYLNSTDVTRPYFYSPRLATVTPFSPQSYHQELDKQIETRISHENKQRQREREEASQHFNNFQSFWGRPLVNKNSYKKENLFKLLHYHNVQRK